jgi:hypothetical protein
MTREVTKLDYEWDIEVLDEHGDIEDHDFQDNYPGTQDDPEKNVVVLVKSYARGLSGDEYSFFIEDRTWAYIKDGELPEEFQDGTRVPQRFHKEVAKK